MESEARLSKRGKDGNAYIEHLKAAQRMTKRVPQELRDAPECPEELLHVWMWFCQLPTPLNFTEIRNWADLTGNAPTQEEAELLMLANNVYQRGLYG